MVMNVVSCVMLRLVVVSFWCRIGFKRLCCILVFGKGVLCSEFSGWLCGVLIYVSFLFKVLVLGKILWI